MGGTFNNVDPDIVEELLSMLDKNNELVKAFRMARNRFENEDLDEFNLVLISSQSSSGRPNHITPSDEVGASIVSDDTDTGGFRDTVVNFKQEGLKRIYKTYPHFMQLQYPLLFPWGTEGYHKRLTPHLVGRLWQQYVVDQFASIEQYRLEWISTHQTTIRADLYNSVRDALSKGDHDPMHVGKAVTLPALFTGSQRYMSQYFKDSLAICRAIGHPSLFLTMTCNSKWPEIQEILKLLPNVDPVDAPNIVSRVFKLKLDQLLDLIKKKNYFGKCIGVMHVIEFQNRDKNSDPIAYEAVKNYMMHGPCGKELYTSACMVKGKCMLHSPKRFNVNTYFEDCGFPVYRMRNTGRVINKKGINLDNQYVVPYNRDLMLRFQCHINLEICNNSRSLKYLFKYCLKGHDTATMLLKKKSNKSGNEQTARSVKNLDESSADLENVCNNVTSKKNKLKAWFVGNSEFLKAQNFMYSDFPTHFIWIKKTAKWKLRKRGDVVGRYKGALSFTQLRTIDGTTYDTFKKACDVLGLLNNDKQWHDALEENAFSAMPTQIWAMFVNILANCSVSDPLALWEKHWPALSDDVLHIRCKISDNIHLTLSEYEILNYALAEIEKLLNDVGKSLRDFHMMPFPDERFFHSFVNRLIVEETSYNKEELRLNHEKAHKNLNSRQLDVYNAVVDNVEKNKDGMFFVYGSGGCGKMFHWQTLCSHFRSKGKIGLPVAGSEIAATLLPDIAELMQHISLIISDEAPMQHRYAFEAVDRSLRDIMVVVDAGRAEIVNASFNKSRLWKSCKNNMHSQEYLRSRSILTPTNIVVDDVNAQILERVLGNVHTYLSQNSIKDIGVDDNDFDSSFPVEYLNSINMPCMPKHELKVKNLAEMEALMFEHILSLDKTRSDWKIKARVTRMWPIVSSKSGITKAWNLILLDDDNTHIYAFASANTWKLIGKNIV
ncbi:uncharacterized protein LOC141698074 [Apium graveolens]|uniref:uncharacterized protein LOC141698074 n=1 Tax=Apium graveolens TaxID=4045 RepID=UPI003D7A1B60